MSSIYETPFGKLMLLAKNGGDALRILNESQKPLKPEAIYTQHKEIFDLPFRVFYPLREFEKLGIVSKTDEGYQITAYGSKVSEKFEELLETLA